MKMTRSFFTPPLGSICQTATGSYPSGGQVILSRSLVAGAHRSYSEMCSARDQTCL